MLSSPSPLRWISRALLLPVALAVALLAHPAQAATKPATHPGLSASCTSPSCLPPNCSRGQSNNCGDVLTRHGGGVQHDPVVYLVFWGPKWTDSSNPHSRQYSDIISSVKILFEFLAGTAYNNILSQYCDSQDCVHNDVRWGGTWFDQANVPSSILNSDFNNIVGTAESTNGWQGTANSQIMIFPQEGSQSPLFDTACGEHQPDAQYSTVWSFVRYASDGGGCDFWNNAAKSMTTLAAHEYAESATDPNGPNASITSWGWSTTNPVLDPIEVADKCQGYNGTSGDDASAYDPSVPVSVPFLWDQSAGYCVPTRGQDYLSPDSTAPFFGFHTVQGRILTEYQSYINTLGEPLTEETPLAGGKVSYFADQVCGGGYVIPTNTGYGGSGSTSGSAIFDTPSTGAHEVQGCIYHEYMVTMKGPGGALGFPVTDEKDIAGGKVSYFAGQSCNGGAPNVSGSAIYYNGQAHEVQGCIYAEYVSVMGGPSEALGFPVTDEKDIAGGKVSYFAGQSCNGGGPNGSGSAIYYNGSVVPFANEVQGCIYHEYVSVMNGPGGALGFPLWDEDPIAGGHVSYFAGQVCNGGHSVHGSISGSAIFDTPSTGAHEVQGCIYAKYWNMPLSSSGQNQNGPAGPLGFPTEDERGITSGWSARSARFSSFQHGGIYYYNGTAHEVQGSIYNAYLNNGGAGGAMGLPTTDEYTNAGGNRESDFENGFILYIPSTHQTIVNICQCS